MTELPAFNEAAALEMSLLEVHEGWKGLRTTSSSGHKAWLTQMKNHYLKIIEADAEAAAEMLATQEYLSNFIRKHGLTNTCTDKTT